MRFERRYTRDRKIAVLRNGVSCCAISEIRNPDGSVVFKLKGIEVPAEWSQVAVDVLAQKYFRQRRRAGRRCAGAPRRACRSGCGARARRGRARRRCPTAERFGGETQRAPGVPPPGRLLDLLGLEGRLLRRRGRRARLLRRAALHAGGADGAPNSPQWFNTGLHWAYGIDGPRQGHYYVDHRDGEADRSRHRPTSARSRTPASSRRRRRPGERGRHHGPVGPRGAPLQVRLGHRHQLLRAARRGRAAVRRRQVVAA